MKEERAKAIKNIREQKPKIAICYDFDKTLSPDDMQTFTLIPSLGMHKEAFWEESNQLAVDNLMDRNLSWMYKMIVKSTANGKSIRRDYFHTIGKDIKLYKGVNSWFKRINEYGEKRKIEVQHYIISSGLKELIEGSSIASQIKRIYASSFLYSVDDIAVWPAQAVNYTNKTQFIFRIAKGKFEEYDESVNDSMKDEELYIPYENIIYIGDSATDIPCMRLVKSKGGYSIGVYDPEKDHRKAVYNLFHDGRINFFAPADYTAKSPMYSIVRQIIDDIVTKEELKKEHQILQMYAKPYALYIGMKKLLEPKLTKKEKEILAKIKDEIEGNID